MTHYPEYTLILPPTCPTNRDHLRTTKTEYKIRGHVIVSHVAPSGRGRLIGSILRPKFRGSFINVYR